MKYYLAIDIGASSGRHIIGYYNKKGLIETDEVYRFKNENKLIDGHLVWDIDNLFFEVKEGIKEAFKKYPTIESMSIDTWAVDYVLLNNDEVIYPCYAYRDTRTNEFINLVHEIIPFKKLYEITGIQFQEFNTIYQLYYDKIKGRLENATDYLMIPEYLMYKLTGVKMHEYTNASTTGLLDASTNDYSSYIIDALGLKKELFKELYKPKTLLGKFKQEIIDEVNGNTNVVFCATHDTASAVEGIPFKKNAPYISSGTWSLLGLKIDKAITSYDAMDANYSNEYGKDYIRFQKNIMGLWITQCLRKEFDDMDFVEMANIGRVNTFPGIFDVNDSRFLSPKSMSKEIINYFKDIGCAIPKTKEDIIGTTYRSLAYSYKIALNELERIVKKKFNTLYIVGGGAKNKLMNELTEEYTKKEIISIPIEATAIGNLKVQMEN